MDKIQVVVNDKVVWSNVEDSAPQRNAKAFLDITGFDISALVKEWEDGDMYMDMLAAYLFKGDSLEKRYYNFLDLQKRNDAFYLSVKGLPPIIHEKGLQIPANDKCVLDTHIPMQMVSDQPFFGAAVYLQNSSRRVVTGDVSSYFTHTLRDSDGKCYPNIGNRSNGFLIPAGLKGLWDIQRTTLNAVEVWNQGNLLFTDPQPYLGMQEDTIKISVGDTTDAVLSAFIIHRKFTAAKERLFNTSMQNFLK